MNGPARVLTDRATVVMALAAFAAATAAWAVPIPLLVLIFAVGATFVMHRPWLFVVAIVVLAAALGARSERALAVSVRERHIDQWVTVRRGHCLRRGSGPAARSARRRARRPPRHVAVATGRRAVARPAPRHRPARHR
jgi:hypothetical protein